MTNPPETPRLPAAGRPLPVVIAGAVILLDRITKVYIRAHYQGFDSTEVIPGWFRLVHTENPGAAFGMLADGSPLIRGIVLVGFSLLVLLFVANTLFRKSQAASHSLITRVALSLILGGAAGNLYDRIVLGTVTDFLEVYQGTWSFPAFNVADSAITVGAVLLFIDLIRPQRKKFSPLPFSGTSKL